MINCHHLYGKYRNPHCCENVRNLPIKYGANKNTWITSRMFEDCLTQLVRKTSARNKETCFSVKSALPTQTTQHLLGILRLYFSQLTVPAIYSFKCSCRKQFIQKIVTMIDGGQLQGASCMKLSP